MAAGTVGIWHSSAFPLGRGPKLVERTEVAARAAWAFCTSSGVFSHFRCTASLRLLVHERNGGPSGRLLLVTERLLMYYVSRDLSIGHEHATPDTRWRRIFFAASAGKPTNIIKNRLDRVGAELGIRASRTLGGAPRAVRL